MDTINKIMTGTAAAIMLAQPALAQGTGAGFPLDTQFGAWTVSCVTETQGSNSCRLVQEQIARDTDALVARFIVQPVEGDAAVMLAQVPIAVFLAGGAVFRLEGDETGPQRAMVWQRCAGDLCEAALMLAPEELAAMDAAGGLLFGYRTGPEGEPVITRVDLTDFAEGVAALR